MYILRNENKKNYSKNKSYAIIMIYVDKYSFNFNIHKEFSEYNMLLLICSII